MAEGPLARALELGAALEARGVPYAIGGALAYGVWGLPRATLDVDINVFLDETALAPVADALEDLGVVVDRPQVTRDATFEGMFVVHYGGYRVDVFTASIPFCAEAERTRVQISIAGSRRWFLSAESIAVFKMMFFRPKDIVDLERMIAVRGSDLDIDYIRAQLAAIVGADDARIVRWDRLTGQLRGVATQEFEVETATRLRAGKLFTVLRRPDGTVFEVELERHAVGTWTEGDRVRIGDQGQLELIARADDHARKR